MKNLFLVFAFVLSAIISYSQNADYKSSQIHIEDGLAHNTVECVFKDSEGFMWFATHNGLNCFDGSEIKTYQNKPGDSTTLSGNKVSCINEDTDGNLWVGTSGNGLNKFNRQKGNFITFTSARSQNSLPNNVINNIKILPGNGIWICTANGLAKYNAKTNDFTSYFPDNADMDVIPFHVSDIIQTSEGEIYVATNRSFIYKFNLQTHKFIPVKYKRDPNLSGNYRKYLAEDSFGNIWISAFSHGLVKYNPKTDESVLYSSKNSELKSDLLNGNFIIKDNKIWLITDGYGILVFDITTHKVSVLDKDPKRLNSLHSNIIYSLFIDDHNIIWAGTFNEGISFLDPNQIKFSTLKTFDGADLSFQGISIPVVYEDSKGRLWIGSDGEGLFQYTQEGRVKQYKHDPNNNNSLSSNRIVCINEDSEGNLYLGTFMGGMNIFDVEKNKFTRYLPGNKPDDLASNHVWDIYIDSEKRIWTGLLGGGLDLFNPQTKTFVHYGPRTDNYNRISHDNVMSIIEDREGDLWFATEGRGVNILDKQTRQMYPSIHPSDEIKLSTNDVKSLYEDSNGIIWIGTVNGGLNRYDKKNQTIEYYNMNNGLPSNIVYSIVEDNNHNIWLGTAYGLSMFNTQTKKFRNYDINDGLMGFVCNRKALFKQADGTILVGTTNGLNVFNPDSMSDNTFKPEVFFTGFRIQNEKVGIDDTINGRIVLSKNINYLDKITIAPHDKIFTLEFAAKTYTLPEKCKFKYKLEGFESNWKTTDASRRYVTYSNLDPGTYQFKILASNSDGIWSDNEKSIQIIVQPTFIQSIWFKLIISIFVLLLFYIWYKIKMNNREKLFKREKEEQQQKIIMLEKEKLESELNNQTFNILSRNKALLKHKRRLNLLVNKVDEKNKTTLLDIIDEIDQEVNEVKDWKHIEPRLDKVYNNFMTTLKKRHVNLTQTELRIAAYVRMGLSTKEISELLQKTTKAVDNERYRLRKKLDVPLNNSLKGYLLDL